MAAQDQTPIEGDNNMLENVPIAYYAILDFKCFVRYMNTRSFQELTAKDVIQ